MIKDKTLIHNRPAMKHYLCCLETGRDFVITAMDDMDAAFTCEAESRLFDDYLIDVEPME
jgi:hypothetical protein